MDIGSENSNVLPRTPCTKKGYEELDVSELNMKVGYSITPASSHMSRSYTENFEENTNVNQDDSMYSITYENRTSNIMATPQFLNNTVNSSVAIDTDANNPIQLSGSDNIDKNLTFLSTLSSSVHTSKALSPTKWSAGRAILWMFTSLTIVFRFFLKQAPPQASNASLKRATPPAELLSQGLNSLHPPNKDSGRPRTPSTSTPVKTNKNKECNSSQLKDFVPIYFDLEEDFLQIKDISIIREEEPLLKSLKQTPETPNKSVSGNHDGILNVTENEPLDINNNSNVFYTPK